MSTAAGTGERWRPAPFGLLGDERLGQRAGAGDARAFAVVYERYHQILYRYCRSILRNEADAQDALQSTFAAAFAALRAAQRDAPMRPWLFRIAHNESISMLRRRRPASELSQAPEHVTTSIEDQVAERAQLSMLLQDLHQLTDRQRSALVLRELSGLSHQEIAIALGTSVGAAKQTIFEARQSLFEFAEGRAMRCDEIRRTISDADGRTLRSRRVRAHLRECGGCAAFAAAIPARTGELRALAPTLPGAAAMGLFGRVAASAGHGGHAGLARLAASAAAKTASVSTGFGANAMAGVAVVATATAGVTVGVGNMVHAMAHRDAIHGGGHAAALRVQHEATGPSALLGTRATPAARADGALPRTAPGTGAAGAPHTNFRTSGTRGARRSRSRFADGRGGISGRSPAAGQSGPSGAYSGPGGYEWRGGPIRVRSGQAPSDGFSPSGASENDGTSQPGSPGHDSAGSGRASTHGSGKPTWAGSRQTASGKGSGDGSEPSPGKSDAGRSNRDAGKSNRGGGQSNAPVAAAVGGTVGSVTTALGGGTTAAVGAVTSTATNTVTGVLGGGSDASAPSAPSRPPLSRSGSRGRRAAPPPS